MKARKYQATEEKTILIALIVHDQVLESVVQGTKGNPRGLFKSKWSNLITKWCFDYYADHHKAPGGLIQDIFVEYAQGEPEDDTIKLVESFLETLSGEYVKLSEQLNLKWVLEKAGDYFEKVRMEKMAEGIQISLERNDVAKARELYSECQPLSFSKAAWPNLFMKTTVQNSIQKTTNNKPVITFKSDLGRFLSSHFDRGSFICFAAPEKRGKSFWLLEVVWQALTQRRKVIYYVVGDMSEDQAGRRLYSRMTLLPWRKQEEPIIYPTSIKIIGKDSEGHPLANITFKEKNPDTFTTEDVIKARDKLRLQIALKEMPLRFKCKGASTISASQVEADIRSLAEEGFIPDVVVIDYADLLLPEPGSTKLDFRHQVDATWKILRRISTDYHLLMITATQAAARSYDHWLIRKGDFSEDKRKNAHVTGMIGINQTPAEKKKGIYRLNWVFLRDGVWAETQYVWTAGNLALGCPCLRSLL
jgi:hypothetical protein